MTVKFDNDKDAQTYIASLDRAPVVVPSAGDGRKQAPPFKTNRSGSGTILREGKSERHECQKPRVANDGVIFRCDCGKRWESYYFGRTEVASSLLAVAAMIRNVVLFCGGRGSATIIKELLEWPDINLTLIVNAYDDGKSTGALRLFIPGMLGPSDFRKNISYLLDLAIPENENLRGILEYRIPGARLVDLDNYWLSAQQTLEHSLRHHLDGLLLKFVKYADGKSFDYSDCSVGNLIFAGAYLDSGASFNGAVAQLSSLFKLRARLLNVSKGECAVLQALKADGTFLPNEAAIVGEQSDVPIVGYYLVADPVTQDELVALPGNSTTGGSWLEHCHDYLTEREAKVEISPEAEQAIEDADMIVYGPGTQHSSLLPSYRIAAENLAAAIVPKVLILNLDHDHDVQKLSGEDLVDRALSAMGDAENSAPVVTHILYNRPNHKNTMTMTQRREDYRNATVMCRKLVTAENPHVHDGALVARALNSIDPIPLRGYDIDGVLTTGIKPKKPYVVISGRTYAENDDFSVGLAQDALAVYLRGTGPYGDHIASGAWKAYMINRLGVTEFHEDREEQADIIRERCPYCTVIMHPGGPRTDA